MTSARIEKNWSWLIIVAWASVLVLAFTPASLWFDVRRVHVNDAFIGQTPTMEVDRVIKRPFQASWVTTVMKKGRKGFSTFCTAQGQNDYRPGNELPDIVELDWWTWPTKCVLPEGEFILNTLWTIRPTLFPEKEIRIQSNVLSVRP